MKHCTAEIKNFINLKDFKKFINQATSSVSRNWSPLFGMKIYFCKKLLVRDTL